MDEDEFGGDLADEDLMLALEVATSTDCAAPTATTTSTTPRPAYNQPNGRSGPATLGSSFGSQSHIAGRSSFSARPRAPDRNNRPTGNGVEPLRNGVGWSAQPSAELEGLPDDAFDSTLPSSFNTAAHSQRSVVASFRQPLRLSSQPQQQQSFRQTTLFGDTLQDQPTQPPPSSNRVYRGDLPAEKPTHHKLDREALKTWVYPTNLGPVRDYQFNIVKNGLFQNTLVALPTGLGKTFIAATVILNFYRWTTDAKMIFVAPTKPLVAQQVEACFHIAGIPRSETTLLTGDTSPALREAEWASKRLFFMTPQTLQNDLSKGYADPKSVALLVIDEAHRATGDYAYVKVIGFLRRFTKSFRVLALTATPGSSVEGVQDVIDNLGVSHVEIRTEESLDLRQYVHARDLERCAFDPSVEIKYVQERLSKALKPFCDKLDAQKIWYGRDPMALTAYGLMKAKTDWLAGPGRHVNQGTKYMIFAVFAVLQSVAHSIKLLTYHGVIPFYHSMAEFRSTTEKDDKPSKYRLQLVQNPDFQEMMMTVERWLSDDTFESHPKIGFLREKLNDHFRDRPPGSNTRAIVFSEYRDSAEEIVRTLNRSGPNIKAAVFVGQADSKRSAGMKQKQQIEAIERFRSGEFNVLVATSIGEEGLDIGQVDLILCYDASSSPIRMLQRMGRTGRKRAGHVILLVMRGKEEEKLAEAQDNYTRMQQLICDGTRFNFRFDLSERIVPRDAKPEVDKRFVDIPIENTQDPSLPEPRKAGSRTKKASKKKFHMPDDVETGFVKASSVLGGQANKLGFPKKKVGPVETDFLAEIPDLETAIKSVGAVHNGVRSMMPGAFNTNASFGSTLGGQDTTLVDTMRSEFLRRLQPVCYLQHGAFTRRTVALLGKMAAGTVSSEPPPVRGKGYLRIKVPAFVTDSGAEPESERDDNDNDDDDDAVRAATTLSAPKEPPPKRRRMAAPVSKLTERARLTVARAFDDDDDEEEEDNEDDLLSRWSKKKKAPSFKPAAKGMTRQRSSQFQAYSFSGGRSETPVRSTVRRQQRTPSSDNEEIDERPLTKNPPKKAVRRPQQRTASDKEETEGQAPVWNLRTAARSSQQRMPLDQAKNEEEKSWKLSGTAAGRQLQMSSDSEESEFNDSRFETNIQKDVDMEEREEKTEEEDPEEGEEEVEEDEVEAPAKEVQKAGFQNEAIDKRDDDDNEVEIIRFEPRVGRGRGSRGGRGARGGRGGRGAQAGGTRGRGRGRGATSSYATYGGRLEERGDDCMRTSDNYESDGSDSGGDLVDFIAPSDEDIEDDDGDPSSSVLGVGDDEDDVFSAGKGGRANRRRTCTSSPITSSPPRTTGVRKPNGAGGGRTVTTRKRTTTTDDDDSDDDSRCDSSPNVFTKKRARSKQAAVVPPPPKKRSVIDDISDDNDDDDDNDVFTTRQTARPPRVRRRMLDSDSD
ncbi:dead box helicase [Niveomyces insectorum RCEF 264]|uniref:ATP-dependent DNA helicase n=1 Tax=Niveomyces insectorum RCEF 264 TaxID=1081102 RepID=A0A167MUH0_9HYPO|nr:dead box helicase [Niveomyces insectorum RCEF 264]